MKQAALLNTWKDCVGFVRHWIVLQKTLEFQPLGCFPANPVPTCAGLIKTGVLLTRKESEKNQVSSFRTEAKLLFTRLNKDPIFHRYSSPHKGAHLYVLIKQPWKTEIKVFVT